MTSTKTNSKAKTLTPSRTRVKELTIARLEALTEKQRLRRPKRRPRLPTVSAPAKAQEAAFAALCTRYEANRKKEPLATQIRTLTERLCFTALTTKRRSLEPVHSSVSTHRLIERGGNCWVENCPRLKETGPAIRSLDRAEALLTRLVWRGAERQARQEMEAKELKSLKEMESNVSA